VFSLIYKKVELIIYNYLILLLMPKNKKHNGSKSKRKSAKPKTFIEADKNFNQEYAYVINPQGGKPAKFTVQTVNNNRSITASLDGKSHGHINKNDLVLIEPIDGTYEHYKIKHLYSKANEKKLKRSGELTQIININDDNNNNNNDDINIGNEKKIENKEIEFDEDFINSICNDI